MNYKESKYNIIQKDIDGNYVMYNVLTNEYCIVQDKKRLDLVLKGKINRKYMVEKGFLIEETKNENSIVEYYLDKKIHPGFLNLFIVPTRFCNFDCIYCYEEHEPLFMSREIQENVIKFIRNNLSKYSGLIVTWFGGEPTVALDAMEYLSDEIKKICKEMKKPYYGAINTNGYELTQEVMEKFLNYNIRYFQICIDGNCMTHNYHRKHIKNDDSFEKIISNLINIKNNIKRGFKVVIRTNITKEILEVMDEYVNMLYQYFGSDDRFWYYWEVAKNHGGERVKDIKDSLLPDEKKFVQYVIAASKLGMKFDYNQFVVSGGFVCALYPYNYWLIDYDGSIQKCTVCFDDGVKLGKIDNGIMSINEEVMANWMKVRNEMCKDCSIYPACGAYSCPYGEHDSCKVRDCKRLRSTFNNIVMMNYYNKREIEGICMI